MAESLHEIIARLSGRDTDEAGRDVEEFVSDIRRGLDEEGACTVQGLGTFILDEGEIRFEASGDLLRAVNAVWGDRETFSVSHVDRDATPSTGAAGAYVDHEDAEAGAGADDDMGDDSEVIVSTPVSDLESSSEDDSSEVMATSVGVADEGADDEASEETDAAGEAKPTAPRRSLRESRNPRHRRRADATGSNSRMPIIIAAGVVVILAAVAIIFWPTVSTIDEQLPGQTGSDTTTAVASERDTTVSDTAAAETDLDSTAVAGAATPQPTGEQAGQPAETPADEAAPDETQAAVGTLDRTSTGYTLIVASSLDEQSARQRLQPFAELGMPYGVLAYAQDDTTRYRLAVGQFPTAATADSVRQAMSDRLPAGTWVWRIR